MNHIKKSLFCFIKRTRRFGRGKGEGLGVCVCVGGGGGGGGGRVRGGEGGCNYDISPKLPPSVPLELAASKTSSSRTKKTVQTSRYGG